MRRRVDQVHDLPLQALHGEDEICAEPINLAYAPPEFIFAEKYGYMLKIAATVLVFAPAAPILYFACGVSLLWAFFVQKTALVKIYARPRTLDEPRAERARDFLSLLAAMHVCTSCLFYVRAWLSAAGDRANLLHELRPFTTAFVVLLVYYIAVVPLSKFGVTRSENEEETGADDRLYQEVCDAESETLGAQGGSYWCCRSRRPRWRGAGAAEALARLFRRRGGGARRGLEQGDGRPWSDCVRYTVDDIDNRIRITEFYRVLASPSSSPSSRSPPARPHRNEPKRRSGEPGSSDHARGSKGRTRGARARWRRAGRRRWARWSGSARGRAAAAAVNERDEEGAAPKRETTRRRTAARPPPKYSMRRTRSAGSNGTSCAPARRLATSAVEVGRRRSPAP